MHWAEGQSERFAVLRGARRYWAVGAIHGQAERLSALHDRLEPRFRRGDRLIYLGNYLGVGDRVCQTLDELLLFRRALLARFLLPAEDISYLRGCQEEMWQKLMQLHLAQDPAQVLEWVLAQGVEATLTAYGGTADAGRVRCREGARALARWTGELRERLRAHPGHDTLLVALRRAALAADGQVLFVHAGIDPSRPLAAQTDSFWWGAGDFAAIREPYEGFRRIVRGYDPAHQGVDIGAVAATIDSGCGFGGPLSAACFDTDGALVERIEA